jgi:hypothetical protein
VVVGLVAVAEPQGYQYYGGQVAAPVFGNIARQVLLYRGVHPERERPMVWPGETVMASLPATPAAAVPLEEELLGDGDDQALWRDPAPAAPAPGGPPGAGPPVTEPQPGGAESDHSANRGGRSHASF